jgi:hypothetical protein
MDLFVQFLVTSDGVELSPLMKNKYNHSSKELYGVVRELYVYNSGSGMPYVLLTPKVN